MPRKQIPVHYQQKKQYKRYGMYANLIENTSERRQWCRSCVFIVNFEDTWQRFSIVDFEQVNVCTSATYLQIATMINASSRNGLHDF